MFPIASRLSAYLASCKVAAEFTYQHALTSLESPSTAVRKPQISQRWYPLYPRSTVPVATPFILRTGMIRRNRTPVLSYSADWQSKPHEASRTKQNQTSLSSLSVTHAVRLPALNSAPGPKNTVTKRPFSSLTFICRRCKNIASKTNRQYGNSTT